MQDWIVINVTDILSATLRTKCPFGFGLRHFAADQNQNEIFSFWSVAVKMSATSRRRIKIANSVPGTTWRKFFPRRCQNQNCILHFWFSKAHFAPLNRYSNVEYKMRSTSSEFERQPDARTVLLVASPPPIALSFTTNEQAAMLY